MPESLDPQCIFAVLERHGVAYVLIGGLAAVIHGSPAMTNDAAIFPDADRDNLARLAATLRDLDARVAVAPLEDIIRSKKAADRPRDRATLPLLYALEQEIASPSGGGSEGRSGTGDEFPDR